MKQVPNMIADVFCMVFNPQLRQSKLQDNEASQKKFHRLKHLILKMQRLLLDIVSSLFHLDEISVIHVWQIKNL